MHIDWAIALGGAGVGFIVGLTGMGGGALMTPMLLASTPSCSRPSAGRCSSSRWPWWPKGRSRVGGAKAEWSRR